MDPLPPTRPRHLLFAHSMQNSMLDLVAKLQINKSRSLQSASKEVMIKEKFRVLNGFRNFIKRAIKEGILGQCRRIIFLVYRSS